MVIFNNNILISCNNIGQIYISNCYPLIVTYLSNGESAFLRTSGNLVTTRGLKTALNENFK